MGFIFVGVGLFPGQFGFVLAAPAQQNTRQGGQSESQSDSWREGPTKGQPNNNQNTVTENPHKWHKGHPKKTSSGDQGDYTTESHRSPIIEVHTTKTGRHRSIQEAEAINKCHLK